MKNRTQPDSRVCYSMSMKKAERAQMCESMFAFSLFTPREQEAEAVHTRREERNGKQTFSKVLLTPYPRRGARNVHKFPLNEQKKVGTSFRF